MHIFIGYDQREAKAWALAAATAESFGCTVTKLDEQRLRAAGLLTRPVDRRADGRYRRYDFNSAAPESTDFAISRFFVPLLYHDGWCLFTDCDVVFLRNPQELMDLADPSKAVMVVQHQHDSGPDIKMDHQTQLFYTRKNWSSVVLWNCGHPAHQRLNVTTLNQWPGRDLHAFRWLADSEIGQLPRCWNWLVGVQPKPSETAIAHFTLGGPFIPNWPGAEHDDIWLDAASRL